MPEATTDGGATGSATRRTRAEQRDASRQRLLDAAFECIVELGYSGASTLVIAQRAGVSSGALFNHFPTKDDLLCATVHDLYVRFTGELNPQLLSEARTSDRPVERIVDVLWDALQSPPMQALYELFAAARTNDHLRAELASVEPANAEAIFAFTRELFPEAAAWPGLRGLMGLVLSTLQGAAVATLAFGPTLDLTGARASLVRAIEAALAEADEWTAAGRPSTVPG